MQWRNWTYLEQEERADIIAKFPHLQVVLYKWRFREPTGWQYM